MPSFVQSFHYNPIDHPPHQRRFPSTTAANTTLNPSTPLLTNLRHPPLQSWTRSRGKMMPPNGVVTMGLQGLIEY
jgi:hypothetical protein